MFMVGGNKADSVLSVDDKILITKHVLELLKIHVTCTYLSRLNFKSIIGTTTTTIYFDLRALRLWRK